MDENHCIICKKYFLDPRMLPCLHTFCEKCLCGTVCEESNTIACPTCSESFPAEKDNGFLQFPCDLRKVHEVKMLKIQDKLKGPTDGQSCVCGREKVVAYCVDTDAYLCVNCTKYHETHLKLQTMPLLRYMNESNKPALSHRDDCLVHSNEPLKMYCTKCKTLICMTCKEGIKHRKHRESCVLIDEVAGQVVATLDPHRLVCEGDKKLLDEAIAGSEKVLEDIYQKKKEVDQQITETLEIVREELLKQNETVYNQKVDELKPQINHLKAVQSSIAETIDKIDALKLYTPGEHLAIHHVIENRAKRMKLRVQGCKGKLVPSTGADITSYITSEGAIDKMIKLGRVTAGGHHPPAKCNAGCLPLAVVGETRTITVTATDEDGSPFQHGNQEVQVVLSSCSPDHLPVRGDTKYKGNGSYSVSFKPITPGEHQLKVTVASVDCIGSPFRYFVHNPRPIPYNERTTQPCTIHTFSHPVDVAEPDEGCIAVAEYGNHTVTLYSKDNGRSMHTFGVASSSGRADKQFHSPSALAVGNKLLYVCESGNHRVQVICWSKWTFLSTFGTKGKRDGQFSNPRGIAIDSDGMIYVADSGNNRIQIFSKDGNFSSAFPCKQPWGLAFDLEGHLHVACYRSNIIQVYTRDGTEYDNYGAGEVKSPAGIAINGEGYIAITEFGGRNRIWIYGPELNLVQTFPRIVKKGAGVASDSSGDFLVVDYSNSCVITY